MLALKFPPGIPGLPNADDRTSGDRGRTLRPRCRCTRDGHPVPHPVTVLLFICLPVSDSFVFHVFVISFYLKVLRSIWKNTREGVGQFHRLQPASSSFVKPTLISLRTQLFDLLPPLRHLAPVSSLLAIVTKTRRIRALA